MNTRLLILFSLCVFNFGCNTQAEPIRTKAVPFPEGGVVTSMVAVPGITTKVFVSAGGHLFLRGEDRWKRIPHESGICEDCQLAGVDNTLLMLKPASVSMPAKLLASENNGVSWREVVLPAEVKSSTAAARSDTTGSASIRATDTIRLFNIGSDVYLIHARHIWSLARNAQGEVTWRTVELTGLPFGMKRDSPLPPVIRNYLDTATNRPFEVITVLSEQLLVFRREVSETEWTLVSTLPTADLEIVGVPGSEAIFLISPDGIRRSDDRGESWFPFWPPNSPKIAHAIAVPQENGAALVVAAEDGSVWRNTLSGGDWKKTLDTDPDSRRVSKFVMNGDTLLASTFGKGVLESKDGGESFSLQNRGLNAAIPNDVKQSQNAAVVITPSGVYRHVESGWSPWSNRSSISAAKIQERLFIGTVSGEILVAETGAAPTVETVTFREVQTVRYGTEAPITVPKSVVDIVSDEGQSRVVAWSRNHGAVMLSDTTWTPLDFDQRFLEVLERREIENFIVTSNGFYLLESSLDSIRLWKGDALGTRWTEVNQFPKSASVQLLPIEDIPQGLWLILDGVLLWSEDGGATFDPVSGPWQAYVCLAIRSTADGPSLLVQTPRRLELYRLRNAGGAPDYTHHPILGTTSLDSLSPNGISIGRQTVALASNNALLVGVIPTSASSVSVGASVALVAILGLLLAAIVFLIARRRDQRA